MHVRRAKEGRCKEEVDIRDLAGVAFVTKLLLEANQHAYILGWQSLFYNYASVIIVPLHCYLLMKVRFQGWTQYPTTFLAASCCLLW